MLCCTVLCCAVLCRAVPCCTVLYCTRLDWTGLDGTVVSCTVMYCTLLHSTVLYYNLLYSSFMHCWPIDHGLLDDGYRGSSSMNLISTMKLISTGKSLSYSTVSLSNSQIGNIHLCEIYSNFSHGFTKKHKFCWTTSTRTQSNKQVVPICRRGGNQVTGHRPCTPSGGLILKWICTA